MNRVWDNNIYSSRSQTKSRMLNWQARYLVSDIHRTPPTSIGFDRPVVGVRENGQDPAAVYVSVKY